MPAGNADADLERQRRQRQRQRRGDAFERRVAMAAARRASSARDRPAAMASKYVEVLHPDRIIEAPGLAEGGDRLRRRFRAHDHQRGIAGQAQHDEGEGHDQWRWSAARAADRGWQDSGASGAASAGEALVGRRAFGPDGRRPAGRPASAAARGASARQRAMATRAARMKGAARRARRRDSADRRCRTMRLCCAARAMRRRRDQRLAYRDATAHANRSSAVAVLDDACRDTSPRHGC